MDFTIAIDQSACIKCGRCVRVCPSVIFFQREPKAKVSVHQIKNCILCGHCVAVCPTDSVEHSTFPAEKVHKIDRKELPTPEQMMMLCKARRSNRAFSDKPIPEAMLDEILEAAHRAPTASNRQEVEFPLVTDPEILHRISALTIDGFASIVKTLKNPILKPFLKRFKPDAYKALPRFHRLVKEFNRGNDLILRKATALILIHTPKTNQFGNQDANLAYQNGSLMAESLGVAQFYTGFVCAAIQRDKKEQVAKLLGIDGTIHAGMALAMPSFKYPKYIDKKDIKVRRF